MASKGYKVFGAIEYFSGRLFSQGIEGRFNSESYQAFLQMIMAQTTEHLFLIHDGARYHTSASTTAFLAAHKARLTEYPLPSYSPDYNPIEYLWKKTKQRDPQQVLQRVCRAHGLGRESVGVFCHASRHGVRALALLRGKRFGTPTGRLDCQKQT